MSYLEKLFALQGKSAFVTGGAQGIGKSVALGMAQCGMNVAIIDLNKQKAEEAAHEVEKAGVKALALSLDVTSPEDTDAMIAPIVGAFGRLDVAFNNAGIANNAPSESIDFSEWKKVIDVNLVGVFLTARAAGRQMIAQGGGGSIVNTASMSAHIVNRPQPQSAYNASKAGVIQLTKSLAVEWAPHGIRVNSISPGYIRTEMTGNLREDWRRSWLEQSVTPVMGTPENLVGGVLYLASDCAAFTTGADLVMDGGFTVV
ncbi:SDR family oxidoreductase [Consotaella salsifontis]|uniref:NAD(P)-dependent dehydrogenase, short-chain alcohol dehydrogenase family n=1 Tax=Consotaella salsifontis TaxID=1365950 RepID=A0A1T4RKY2_9HYPH|nr:SDR family oxidoreductase [Consotaella salsifontis]SKA16654.1 NAD(P)-dependent dehydrogenase, short-chain alcohol dehydrogenase family [Consotaella salsifontis]